PMAFTNWLKGWKVLAQSSRPAGRRRSGGKVRPGSRLGIELLEDRTVPSTITWANEFDLANNFNRVFGTRAAQARQVVEAALGSWAHVIPNFHTSTNTYSINISIDPNDNGRGGATHVNTSENGIPTSGTMTLQSGANGDGSYLFLDPTVPADPNQFDPVDSFYLGTNQNAFA